MHRSFVLPAAGTYRAASQCWSGRQRATTNRRLHERGARLHETALRELGHRPPQDGRLRGIVDPEPEYGDVDLTGLHDGE
jgi:hypothetical protein